MTAKQTSRERQPSIWSAERLSPGRKPKEGDPENDSSGHRSEFERDYDRILFSTPVRRLSDKTQVFPLDNNDGVRTRLTHSHEVANLARSIGARIAHEYPNAFENQDLHQVVLPILSSIGLAHDLGNPPFGHQGEAAVSKWFKDREAWIFDRASPNENAAKIDPIPHSHLAEFLSFDGNPQSFRLLTRLQTSMGKAGLDLTAATLAASIKYPIGADNVVKGNPVKKKFGYFLSEAKTIAWVREKTGLREGQRHPLTWIMESADDIAYSVLDVEDAMKKGIISPDDLLNILTNSQVDGETVSILSTDFKKADESKRSPKITRDIKIAYARARLIEHLIDHAARTFIAQHNEIFKYECERPLMQDCDLCDCLKDVAYTYAFSNSDVLYIESRGRDAIFYLLSSFWEAISEREGDAIDAKRTGAFSRFAFSLISSNYLEAAVDLDHYGTSSSARSLRYREARLLTDMISGMTDSFALHAFEQIKTVR